MLQSVLTANFITSALFDKLLISRLGNSRTFQGKFEILIVALSKSTFQSQRSRVQVPVGA